MSFISAGGTTAQFAVHVRLNCETQMRNYENGYTHQSWRRRSRYTRLVQLRLLLQSRMRVGSSLPLGSVSRATITRPIQATGSTVHTSSPYRLGSRLVDRDCRRMPVLRSRTAEQRCC